jgi:hypothetical protein
MSTSFLQTVLKKNHKWEFLFVAFIFVLSVLIRWYFLPQYLFFGFEQGRDAKIIQDIFYTHEFKLVGPKTDLAGIFHGAYYYYLLLPVSILTQGNPLAASLLLVVLSSLTVVIGYFFARDFFRSSKAAVLASLLIALSYEYIIYARWLSNVTPAIPLILFTFWMLWKYHQDKKPWQFLAAVITAMFAAQFEVVLVLLFGWVFLCLFITKNIRWPNWKTFFSSLFATGIIFAPHALFNFRNQNIILQSIIRFITGSGTDSARAPLDLIKNVQTLFSSYQVVFQKSLSFPKHSVLLMIISLIILVGVLWSLRVSQKRTQTRLVFLTVWLLMSLPVVLFHDVAQLTQLYLGVGLAMIFFFVLALQSLWSLRVSQRPVGKGVVLSCLALILWGAITTVHKLQTNQDVFFITIQEGMNYIDQQKALQFIHDDAAGKTYRFVSYTIPYLQPEGWQYLQHFLFPKDKTDDGSKLVYIVIEKQVDPFWQKKWTEDLGTSTLVSEETFGLIRVQKRALQ